jgi:ABC-type lipoprotein export system ATPase subunit/ABC-type lipoprotein release transport system permease subunit
MSQIKIENLKKSYQIGNSKKQEVLKGLSLTLHSGELAAILGESGSGKSTLLNLIGGLDTDYEGSIEINGERLEGFSDKQLDDYRKLKIGFIFQSFNLISTYTVMENILTPANMTTAPQEEKKAEAFHLIKRLHLEGLEDKLPSLLSGGEKQRVAIARALMNDPDILFADEPTGALDRGNAQIILSLLQDIAREGKLVIVVTHSQKVANGCSRIIHMEYGIIASDTGGMQLGDTGNNNCNIAEGDRKALGTIKPRKLKLVRAISTAYKNIRKNKTRNLLVSIGTGIGIFAVVILLFLSDGMKNYIEGELYSDTNPLVIEVTKGGEQKQARLLSMIAGSDPFTKEEVDQLSLLDGVADIEKSSTLLQSTAFEYGGETGNIALLSTINSNYMPTLKLGNLPQPGEILVSESLAGILTEDIGELTGKEISLKISLDKDTDPVEESYLISGIIENSGSPTDRFKAVYMSYSDLEQLYGTGKDISVNGVYLLAENKESIDGIKQAVKDMGFSTTRQDARLEYILNFLGVITAGLTGVAAISLIVSGIMILVVLYISVVERTKEIGTLRALGACRSDIRKIFVSEGMLLGVGGGITGILLSVSIGEIANLVSNRLLQAELIHITPGYMLLGIGISILISIIASLLPAAKASRLDPIVALRYE